MAEQALVSLAPSLLRGNSTETSIADVTAVDVPATAYVRGCRNQALSHGTLLDEAIRFLDFGARQLAERARRDQVPAGQTTAVETLVRNHDPMPGDSNQFKVAISKVANALTPAFYEHVRRVYGYDRPDGLCANADITRLVQFPPGANRDYVGRLSAKVRKRIVHDRYQLSLLLPRLICDSWATTEARARIFDYGAVAKAHASVRSSIAQLDPREPAKLAQAYVSGVRGDALMGADRVGAARTVVPAGDQAGFLFHFAEASNVGLTEKVVSTLTTLALRAGPLERVTSQRGRVGATSALAQAIHVELDKLLALPPPGNPRSQQGPPPSPPELPTRTWIRSLQELQVSVILPLLARVKNLVPDANAQAFALGDLAWALILTDCLILWLLHLEVVTLLAATPFRQIYEGGLMLPLLVTGEAGEQQGPKKKAPRSQVTKKPEPLATVEGIMGVAGVAFWEYLGGDDTPHEYHDSARNSFSPQLERKNWIADSDAQARTLDVTSRLQFEDSLPAKLDTVETLKGLAFSEHLDPTKARYVDRVALANRIPLPRQDSSRERWKKAIDECITGAVAVGSTVSVVPRGLFAIPIEHNPRFHDSIYNGLGEAGALLPLFEGWGGPVSSIGFGAKLECHLQAYVFAWLYRDWYNQQTSVRPPLAPKLIFTCACAQYGGKFPPHITHRTGYGFDFSLTDGAPRYQWSVNWPQDSAVVSEKNQESLGEYLLSGRTFPVPLSRAVSLLRRQLKSAGPAAQPVLDALGQGQPRFTIGKHGPKRKARVAVGTKGIAQVIPREALVCAWDDRAYVDGRSTAPISHPAGGCEPVFREFLREYVSEIGRVIKSELVPAVDLKAQNIDATVSEMKARFVQLENTIDDWPIMPDPASHISHHFGHLALLLSFPREVIWGAPLYHLRAMRTILSQFAALRVPNPFASAKGVKVPADYSPALAEAAKQGPLPVPDFLFLPHNHHHHWHVNFWAPVHDKKHEEDKKAARKSPHEEKAEDDSKQAGLHLAHIRKALPYWRLLGVDFVPFLRYLDNMNANLQIARGPREALGTRIKELKEAIVTVPGSIVDSARAADFRARLFNAVLEQSPPPPTNQNLWLDRPNWPSRGSPLSAFIKSSREIGDLALSYAQRFVGVEGNVTREEITDWLAQLKHEDIEETRARALSAQLAGDEIEDIKEQPLDSPAAAPLEETELRLDPDLQPLGAD